MAVEAKINADDHWFAGERKIIRHTVYADRDLRVRSDITGWTLRWRLFPRGKTELGDAVLTKVPVITDGPIGMCEITFSAVETADLPGGQYFYDLWRIDPDEEQVLAFGGVVLRNMRTS